MELRAKAAVTAAVARRSTAALAIVLAALGLFAAAASATTLYYHPLLGKFGPKGPGQSAKFVSPLSVAVDQGSHQVYVFDQVKGTTTPMHWILYRFTAAGEPDPFTAGAGAGTNAIALEETPQKYAGYSAGSGRVAVAPPGSPGGTAGDVYVVLGGQVQVLASTGAALGVIDGSGNPNPGGTVARSVTTDPAGILYIGYKEHLDKYVPSANPPKNFDFDSELRFEGLDPEHQVCDAGVASSTVYVSVCNGAFGRATPYPLASFPGGGGSVVPTSEGLALPAKESVVVDPSSDEVYVTVERPYRKGFEEVLAVGIGQYDTAGNLLGFLPVDVPDFDRDWASGQIYLGGRFPELVSIYGDGEPVQSPTAEIDPVTEFDFNSAHLSGTVNPGASGPLQETTYRFVCNPECPSLEEQERTVPGDGVDHPVSGDATELQPETHYEVTLVARNANFTPSVPAAESRSTTSFDTAPKPPADAPEVTIDPVTSVTAESAHVSGTVDPKGTGTLQETTYRFEYSSDGTKWLSGGDQGPIEGGAREVSATLEGLDPNTSYEVRLVAENVGGASTSAPPNPAFTTAVAPPLVETTHANHVLATSAQLNGRVDPRGTPTAYYFEWGTGDCATESCAAVPLSEDADAGAGHGFAWVSAQLEGLQPGQEYSYRLVAVNAAGKTVGASSSFMTEAPPAACPNEDARSGESGGLPDCRAYEMVSPLDKNGGNIASQAKRTRVAFDGGAVTYKSTAAFAGATGAPFDGTEYISVRGPEGWETHPISPYQQAPYNVGELAFTGMGYMGRFSPDLDTGVFRAFSAIPGPDPGNVGDRPNLYLGTGLRSGSPHFQLLTDSEAPLQPYREITPYLTYADASSDFGKVAFETHDNLTAEATGEQSKVYEEEGGTVRLAGILPDSACGSPPCVAARSVAGGGAQINQNPEGGVHTVVDHTVSADGSKVFFTVPDPGGDDGVWTNVGIPGHIYARIDGKETVQIDAGVPDPDPGESRFDAASADGNVVYFDNSGTDSVYRYDFEAPAGQRLTALTLPAAANDSPEEVLGVSESGDIAYVRSRRGLWVFRGGEATRIAPAPALRFLQDQDGNDTSTFRITPNGHVAVFGSYANLVGYDPVGSRECTHNSPCLEVYVYNLDSGELTCASCNFGHAPTGEAIYTNGQLPGEQINIGLPGGPEPSENSPLSSDGRYVFFSSPDALVPQDSNGQYDAYVYNTEKQKVRLISTGHCNCKSFFMNASPSGHDAFFTTYQRLVRADTDNLSDLYDARVGGGIAAQNALPAAECQGDACQGVPSSPPQPTPASESFSGPGSPPPTRHRPRKRHGQHHSKHKHARHGKQGGSK